ncbi:hypothetical protein [Kitasatospora sp. NPDC056531]|uniref:hypothetical protein n=1 Tax=Kitasatospora sp. NPDC056531 TaxID=3345856 RepID=UPI0036739DF5
MGSGSTVQEFVAVRSREQITAARLAAVGERPEACGAQAAYHWVLQPNCPAPVSGTRLPSLRELDLAVEERAAIEAARDTGRPLAERAFARGAARAIGWVLGFAPLDD